MIVIEENAFSILQRRLNRIEGLILEIKESNEPNLQPGTKSQKPKKSSKANCTKCNELQKGGVTNG